MTKQFLSTVLERYISRDYEISKLLKLLAISALSCFSLISWADGSNLANLSIQGNILTVEQQHIRQTLPTCVANGNGKKWAVDLTNDAGQGAYATLLAAVNLNKPVQIEGDGQCHTVPGIETAVSVVLTN
ncbi:hypothetical protein [Bowmanella denitrificans]|uniref:hypothetical protein n=1 Tax=Bowmanella denitrificans TaxID=366582 RepID=UPI000C9C339C|nr:hypothetical protein [Bowmanella denitrificans]